MSSYDQIQSLLAKHPLEHQPGDCGVPAAVALITRCREGRLDILFIERATRAGDPWSGDLGFPGGKVEQTDRDEQEAAERETAEEIGVDLATARFLGRLGDISGTHLPVRVSCFVYGMLKPVSFRLEDEVRRAFWVPLEVLCDPQRHLEAVVRGFDGAEQLRPAIRILDPGETVLWGLTYRLVMQFIEILNRRTDGMPWPLPEFNQAP